MPNTDTARVCRRCLLEDLQDSAKEAEYYQSVIKYRQALPPDKGVDDATYKSRLNECRKCTELVNGMCSQCGCYVEIRAAAKKMHCPKPGNSMW